MNRVLGSDELQLMKLKDLLPTNYNAKIVAQVLRVLMQRGPSGGNTPKKVIVLIRDANDTALLHCWDMESIVRAQGLKVCDTISIERPDIRFHEGSQSTFPTTIPYELHIDKKADKFTNDKKIHSNLNVGFSQPVDFSTPIIDSWSQLSDVCIECCVNSIVTVGVVLVQIGEIRDCKTKFQKVSKLRSIRIWDQSIEIGKYINISVWEDDCFCFDQAAVGEFVIIERAKVIQYRGRMQLSSAHHTVYHFHNANSQSHATVNAWSHSKNLSTSVPSSIPIQVQATEEENSQNPTPSSSTSSNIKKRKKSFLHDKRPDGLITDYFKAKEAESPPLPSSPIGGFGTRIKSEYMQPLIQTAPITAKPTYRQSRMYSIATEKANPNDLQNFSMSRHPSIGIQPNSTFNIQHKPSYGVNHPFHPRIPAMKVEYEEPISETPWTNETSLWNFNSLPSRRFSVYDALNLEDGKWCWSVATLHSILALSSRGLCIFNCFSCNLSQAECTCGIMNSNLVWLFNCRIVWKDHESELSVVASQKQCNDILGITASSFSQLDDNSRFSVLDSVIGGTYKIQFKRVGNVISMGELFLLMPHSEE